MRRAWVTYALIVAGLLLTAIPFVQQGVAAVAQSRLRSVYAEQVVVHAAEVSPDVEPMPKSMPESLPDENPTPSPEAAADTNGEVDSPEPDMARIIIAELGIDAVVVDGTFPWDLAQGPGFYPEGSRPDLGGNVAVAGHRTTYGAWFRHLDRLDPGDAIELIFAGRVYLYEVERVWTIAHNDWSVIAPTDDHVLTLTTCHPPGSSRQRLVVRARWVGTAPLAAGVP